MLYKHSSSAATDADPVKGIVKGYFAHFGSKDSDGDIIQKSAFDKTVRENGPAGTNRIKHILNHDQSQPLGALKELTPDQTGLAYVSQLLKYGDRFLPNSEMVLAGIEQGYKLEHSIGYGVPKGKSEKTTEANLLHEVALYEGSTLTFYGANPNTPITGLKSHTDALDLLDALARMLKTGNWQDDTYQLIQEKYNQVALLFKQPTQPDDSTEPDYAGLASRLKSKFTL